MLAKKIIVIGIDPGKNGGYAVVEVDINTNGKKLLCGFQRSDEEKCMMSIEKLKNIRTLQECLSIKAVMEEVHAMPRQGVASMFSFGRELGFWEGLFKVSQIPIMYVPPQQWQKATISGMAGFDSKERSIRFALAAFPENAEIVLIPPRCRKYHDGVADAICLAWYGAEIEGKL